MIHQRQRRRLLGTEFSARSRHVHLRYLCFGEPVIDGSRITHGLAEFAAANPGAVQAHGLDHCGRQRGLSPDGVFECDETLELDGIRVAQERPRRLQDRYRSLAECCSSITPFNHSSLLKI